MQAKKAFEGFTESPITHLPFVSFCLHDSVTNIGRYRTYRFSAGVTTDPLGYDFKWAFPFYFIHVVQTKLSPYLDGNLHGQIEYYTFPGLRVK